MGVLEGGNLGSRGAVPGGIFNIITPYVLFHPNNATQAGVSVHAVHNRQGW